MKKLIPLLTVIGLVLAVGLAYANESMPMAKDLKSVVQDDGITYAALDNGVTFVGAAGTVIQCSGEGGVAGGGTESKELRMIVQDDRFIYTAVENEVSFSAEILNPTCSWALGRKLELHNGISIPGGTQDQ